MRTGYAGLGLQNAGLGCFELRAADFDIALGLHEFLFIGVQRTGGGVGIGFRSVILLLGDFALFHQRKVAREVGLRELRVGAGLLDIGLGIGQIGGLRLFVGGLGAHQVGLCAGELCLGAGGAASGIFAGSRNVHASGAGFAFGEGERAFGLVKGGLIIRGIELDENLAGFHRLIVVHLNFGDASINFRGNRRDVAINLGVVGAFTVVEVKVQAEQCGQQNEASKDQACTQLGTDQGVGPEVELLGFSVGYLYVYRIFQSYIDLNTHGSSLRVSFFHLPDGAREVGTGLIETVERRDLVIVGAGKRILGRNHFDIVGDAGFEAVAGLSNFFLRELHAEICDLHFTAGGLQVQKRGLHVESDLVAEIGVLLVDFLQLEIGFDDFRADAAAGEERHVCGNLVLIRGNAAVGGAAIVCPVTVETQRGQALILRGLLFEFRGFFLRFDGFPFLASR